MPITASWISKKEDRCGGDACVRDTRITVWGLVAYRRLEMSEQDILMAVQGLTAADLEAAWEYAATHAAEIDQAIRANEDADRRSCCKEPRKNNLIEFKPRGEVLRTPGMDARLY